METPTSNPEQDSATKPRGWWVYLVPCLFGAALLVGAGFVDGYWRGLLLNVGSAVLVFVPLFTFQRRVLEDAVGEVKTEVDRIDADVAEARKELQGFREQYAARLEERRTDDTRAMSELESDPSFAALRKTLDDCARDQLFPLTGPRIYCWGVWLRFVLEGEQVRVGFETGDGTQWGALTIADEYAFEMCPEEIRVALGRRGRDPGDLMFDPAEPFQKLASQATLAYDLRHGVHGEAAFIGALESVPLGQWAITTEGVQAIDGHWPHYLIETHRLSLPMWDSQVTNKNWVDVGDFRLVLETARELLEAGRYPEWMVTRARS